MLELGRLMIWFDNCGRHKAALLNEIIDSLRANIACLPPNMTGVLLSLLLLMLLLLFVVLLKLLPLVYAGYLRPSFILNQLLRHKDHSLTTTATGDAGAGTACATAAGAAAGVSYLVLLLEKWKYPLLF